MKTLPLSFYQRDDVVALSQELLGHYLFTEIDGVRTGGIITETEAYRGPEDRASHAYGMRRTKRNEMMYHDGGYSYVYLCYGIHALFNVVTNKSGVPHAILIRAIEPTVGIDTMLSRRKKLKQDRTLTTGPGALSQALGITTHHNGLKLTGTPIWIEKGQQASPSQIIAGPRVGIDYAGEDAKLPWRFRYLRAGNT